MTEERPEFSRPSLSPSEEMMLEWIRDGLVDAEIAVRLGISNQDVKERIERLASRMGVRDRDALRNPLSPHTSDDVDDMSGLLRWPVPEDGLSKRRIPRPALMLVVVVIAAGVAFTLSLLREPASDDRRADDLDKAFVITSDGLWVTSAGRATPTPIAPIVVRDGRAVVDAGVPFYVRGETSGIVEVSKIEGRHRLTLSGNGVLRLENGVVSWQPTL
jgi:DNA-binding CsgD family transcriptional regulator